MKEKQKVLYADDKVTVHPGALLKDFFIYEFVEDFAKKVGYPSKYIYGILDGYKNMTPDFAKKVGRLLKISKVSPDFFTTYVERYNHSKKNS